MYDYVVVGAGSAGCAVAARLSEDPRVDVALIEAGPPDTADDIHIPAAFGTLFKSPWDWDLDTEAEPELHHRRVYLPRGRMLGGSSSMNAMIYVRGSRADYEDWGEGWSYEDLLPVFRRSEDNERGADPYHGVGGPLRVSDSRSLHPLADAFVEAGEEAGYPANPDFNGPSQLGVGRFQVTQRDGLRCSAADAFLRPAMRRPNLTVLTGAFAHRVLFEHDRAVGVEVLTEDGQVAEVRAHAEVVLSAGTYGSAQLLLLSGIGPADQLRGHDIDVLCDLPVGQDLQDHYTVMLNYLTDQESLMTAFSPDNLARLHREGRGPLTSNVGEAGGFFQTRPGLAGPDLQFHLAPGQFYAEGLGPATAHGFAFGPCLIKPTSVGAVTLRTATPGTAPRIVHNYLGTAEDRAAIVDGLRIALELADQPAVRSVITGEFVTPASHSEEHLLDFARTVGHTLYHPTSTCAMGAVVDTRLRVRGIDGLRVADASVMPTVTRGNTNAPSIMIGERAAELIRADGTAPAGRATEATTQALVDESA